MVFLIKSWLLAARLRTLPLSLSGIFLGSFIAYEKGSFNWIFFLLACLTTILLQVLSNFANDYGDGVKGSDKNRTGEQRAVSSGLISAKAMRNAVTITSILSLISATSLLFLVFRKDFYLLLFFFFLAVSAITAAIKYTVGKNAYGYKGLGDLFVFIFFGLVAVFGTYTLYHKEFWLPLILPAASIGMLSMAVLNLNNMRDYKEDKKNNKNTLVVYMGLDKAKKYHTSLLLLPFLLSSIFVFFFFDYEWYSFSFLIMCIPIIKHLAKIRNIKNERLLDSELKVIALSTFIFSILLGIGLL